MTNFTNLAIKVPTILLPQPNCDLTQWSVIACDQYTSQLDYWEKVEQIVGNAPSTLRLIFPEIFLDQDGNIARIRQINETMQDYLSEEILRPLNPGFILLDRKTKLVSSRKGLIVALDLEEYDYSIGSQSLIRATEGTILERLPPRIKVRENASIESPHIMVLIDDPNKTVIEPLFELPLNQIYDFDLMLNGGHIKGYLVNEPEHINQIADALSALLAQISGQCRPNQSPLLYAMGDGNHSLATAKAIWEKLKAEATDQISIMEHPARYALVELVNIHDEGLEFEAIHRLLFNTTLDVVVQALTEYCHKQGLSFATETCNSLKEAKAIIADCNPWDEHVILYVHQNNYGLFRFKNPKLNLEIATFQNFLDDFVVNHPNSGLDYIHGEDAVIQLSSKPNSLGFILPAISKHSFFKSISEDGVLPRKTFSMGDADEKRFYLECRAIQA